MENNISDINISNLFEEIRNISTGLNYLKERSLSDKKIHETELETKIVNQLKSDNEVLTNSIMVISTDLNKKNATFNELQDKFNNITNQFNLCKIEKDKFKNQSLKYHNEIQILDENKNKASINIKEHEFNILNLKEKNKTLETELEKVQIQLEEKIQLFNKLKEENLLLEKNISDSKIELNEANSLIDIKSNDLDKISHDLEIYKTDFKNNLNIILKRATKEKTDLLIKLMKLDNEFGEFDTINNFKIFFIDDQLNILTLSDLNKFLELIEQNESNLADTLMKITLNLTIQDDEKISKLDNILKPEYSLIKPNIGDLLEREIHKDRLIENPQMSGKVSKIIKLGLKESNKVLFKAEVEVGL